MSYPDFVDFRKNAKSFESLAAYRFWSFGFQKNRDAVPEMQFGLMATANFFGTLGVMPALGREFRPDEDSVPGRDAVAIISHDLWETEFGSSKDVIGKNILLSGINFTIIGVAPRDFTGVHQLIRTQVYVPLMMWPRLSPGAGNNFLEDRKLHAVFAKGRLKPGVSLASADAEARVLSAQIAEAHPETNRNWSTHAISELAYRVQTSPPDGIISGFLLALAAVVLLIACANVANLMLSRARARSREIAIRLAICAGRLRLIRQLLTESAVIGIFGGGLGLLVAQFAVDALSNITVPGDIPITIDVRIDPQLIWFAVAVTAASVVFFGLVPALQATRADVAPALKNGTNNGAKRGRFIGRNVLVVGQVAGSLLLLVIASQIVRGSSIIFAGPAGFRINNLLTVGFDPVLLRYTQSQTDTFYKRLMEQSRELPGVKSASLTSTLPMGSNNAQVRVAPEGYQLPPGNESVTSIGMTVGDGYFETAGVPIVSGRGFRETDKADSPRVAVVNEQFARKYFPGQSVVGKRLRYGNVSGPSMEVIGVAKMSKYIFPFEVPLDVVYLPFSQNPQTQMTLLLETERDPAALAGPLRGVVRSLDNQMPMLNVQTMAEYYDVRARKTFGLLIQSIEAMALIGLALAITGLYGLMAYQVSRRTREIGIRMAIGAGRGDVVRLLMRQGLGFVAAGLGIGLALAIGAAKLASSQLYGSGGFDVVTFVAVPIVLIGVAAMAI
ncbi:MAG TPA: ABC transporter permease, partial [Bryobacteraceae bacterium]|nr:ABC transporter permease [Bryobacteraceae bacterium]